MLKGINIVKNSTRALVKTGTSFKVADESLHKTFIGAGHLCLTAKGVSQAARQGEVLSDPLTKSALAVRDGSVIKSTTIAVKHKINKALSFLPEIYNNPWAITVETKDGVNYIAIKGTDSVVLEGQHCLIREQVPYKIGQNTYMLSGCAKNFMSDSLSRPVEGGEDNLIEQGEQWLGTLDKKAKLVISGHSAGTVPAVLLGLKATDMGFTDVTVICFAPVPFCSIEAAVEIQDRVRIYNIFSPDDPIPQYHGPISFLYNFEAVVADALYELLRPLKDAYISDKMAPRLKGVVEAYNKFADEFAMRGPLTAENVEMERDINGLAIPGYRVESCLEWLPYLNRLSTHKIENIVKEIEAAPKMLILPPEWMDMRKKK